MLQDLYPRNLKNTQGVNKGAKTKDLSLCKETKNTEKMAMGSKSYLQIQHDSHQVSNAFFFKVLERKS